MARSRRDNGYIPEELVFEILSLLPVESLLRFKSVCKSWLFIISDTRFVRTHLANSFKKQPVLFNYQYFRVEPYIYIEVHDPTTHQDFVKLNVPPSVTDLHYVNSCDGLVCLSNFDSSVIHIWNPSTKRFKLLPPPNKKFSRWYVYVGLGYDSISDDYKLIRIGFKTHSVDPCPPEPELYSANADSWKEIRVPTRLQQIHHMASKWVPVKSGVLCYAFEREVLAFDLHNEVFTLYPFPKFGLRSEVLDFEGYVAMIFQDSDGSGVSLYILDDVCGKGSWTKMFNLEADIKIDWVVRYLGIGQFFARSYVDPCVFSYDYKKGETKKYLLHMSLCGTGYPFKYTESLVSLNGFEQVQVESLLVVEQLKLD